MEEKTEKSLLPPCDQDFELIKHALTEVEMAVHDQDYSEAFKLASKALPRLKQSLVTMIDIRVHTFLKQCKFQEAIKDAEDMITYEPTSATGYLRLGNLHGMQGKQQRAIDTYNLGLQCASVDHPDYAQMVDNKDLAMKRSKVRVDFIARLPFEIMHSIIALLPSKCKSVCLTVSSIWCSNVVRCSTSFSKAITIDSTSKGVTVCMTPDIADNVEDLTFNTANRPILLRSIHCMSTGSFRKLKFLKLQASATKNIDTTMDILLSRMLWEIGRTLTTLALDLHEDTTILTVMVILSACANLTKLEYTTTDQLSNMIGEVMLLRPHSALVDMELTAETITGQDLQKLLPHCRQLRQLLLYGCDATVLDVVDQLCPDLEILGYNPQDAPVPKLNSSDAERNSPGLHQFYTCNGAPPVSASILLPLIRRNMHSLKAVYANISAEDSPSNIIDLYSDLNLKNLEELTFWDDDTGVIQPLLLRSISTCSMLTSVSAACSTDIPGLVDVLADLPQLETLELSHISSTVGETDLIRLFEVYARDSQSGQRRLKTIRLQNCEHIVTDNVLAALSGIVTLDVVAFEGLSSISAHGIADFFMKLGNNVTDVELASIDAITDSVLTAIGHRTKNLKLVTLRELKNISDAGIMDFTNQLPKLQSLTIGNCQSVTQNVVTNVKTKVQSVVFTQ